MILSMPHKYILVSQLYARTPFHHCQLRFIVKSHINEPSIHTAIPFTTRVALASPGQYIDFEYEEEHLHALGMYVLAIHNNEVVSIGCIPLRLDQDVREKKEYLKGIMEQNGYVIYSSRETPFDGSTTTEKENIGKVKNDKKGKNWGQGQSDIQQGCSEVDSPINQLRALEQHISRLAEQEGNSNTALPVNNQPIINNFEPESTPKKDIQLHSYTNKQTKQKEADNEVEQACLESAKFLLSHKRKNGNHHQNLLLLQQRYQQQCTKLRNLDLLS